MITRRLPLDGELLQVDDLVGVHDLLDESACFRVVHGPDLLDALVIGLLESLKSLLQLDELIGGPLVLTCMRGVLVLGLFRLNTEESFLIVILPQIAAQSALQTLLLPGEHILSLLKHTVIKLEFRLIELVDGFHVLHALLKDLHLSLELDLLLGLLVGILAHGALEVSRIVILLLLPHVQVLLLNVAMVFEQLFDLDLVTLKDVTALAIELGLNVVQFGAVALAHGDELVFHLSDECVNVLRHLCDRFDIVAVLLVNLIIELSN